MNPTINSNPLSMPSTPWSARAKIVTRRTYNRPLNEEGTVFESWDQTCDRVVGHQRWLWERAQKAPLNVFQNEELSQLRALIHDRRVMLSGRTLWLGGTPISQRREATQFNCSFTHIETVYDVVDALWLLLNGAGVGFKPVVGSLTGFTKPVADIEVIRSTRTDKGGEEHNTETWDVETKTWTLRIGDSSEAWAKSAGKLLAMKVPAKKIVLDFSQLRPKGMRLSNYGWISSGDENICKAFLGICKILNQRASSLLTKLDILDVMNWLGTSLSSRRAAEIAFIDYGDEEWFEFALFKKDHFSNGNDHRQSSNNSLMFWDKPTKEQLQEVFDLMMAAGGSEPGFVNARAAKQRAPWFSGGNPCFEILLGNKTFCNLVEIDLAKYRGNSAGLAEATRLIARANYRQTAVNLKDGILQEAWHLNNEFLRLCGVGLTGIAMRPDMGAYHYKEIERVATMAAYSMADELDLPRPKNVTCVKPSGTLSKAMDTTEGLHKPLARFIFNWVNFALGDPLIDKCREAGYKMMSHPVRSSEILICLPVENIGVQFDRAIIGGQEMEVNLESAVTQLERYKLVQNNWTHQNSSVTISYDPTEVPAIVDWLMHNWDSYVGVSFIYRTDPTKTAADLGYAYLPQQPVTEKEYRDYVIQLKDINMDEANSLDMYADSACSLGGACPVR